MKQPFRKRETPTPAREAIAEFAAGADDPKPTSNLDKNAPRTRRTQYPFNEYEYNQVKAAAQATGRTMLGFMRYSVMQEAARVLEKEKE